MTFQHYPVPQPVFPTLDSLDDINQMIENEIPKPLQNKVLGIVMTYHNTLLKVQSNFDLQLSK